MTKIVVKDFYAEWCPPCKMLAPIIEKLEKDDEFKDKISFLKINVDKDKEQAMKYGVQSIPTIVIEKEDKIVEKMIGFQSEELLREKLRSVLK